jgi:tetratricopeptide (TPR) repeat protein
VFLFIILQIALVDSSISSYENANYQQAYRIAHSISTDSLSDFERYEVLELRAYTATSTGRYEQADSLFQIVFETEHESILSKAYANYAELMHVTFRFEKRLTYMLKAYEINPKTQYGRIIARHYFQIEADYKKAQEWIDKLPTTYDRGKDQAGYYSLRAEFAESKRQYEQAIDYYRTAKIEAKQTNLFSYELFASEGVYRTKRLFSKEKDENMQNIIVWVILSIVGYYYIKKLKSKYVRIDKSKS